MPAWSKELKTLDPQTDYERMVYLLSVYEFSWDIEKALEFALFRTYAVPSISGLLSRTGAFGTQTRKRYDDTELILSEIAENGQDSENGRAAITRMNDMHARYKISNDDMLYVLSTFVVEPVTWLSRFGKRPMRPTELEACVAYYKALGTKMGIRDIPNTFADFKTYQQSYETRHFRFAETNAEIGSLTRDLLLSMYVPSWLVASCRPIVHAVCDENLRRAMGFADPPRWLERTVHVALLVRARAVRALPARRRPRLLTKRKRPTYPSGYRIGELGTFK